jgi:putative FmdB family regulatory protein
MPIYVWKCTKCGNTVEELRKMGEDNPPESSKCECGEGDFERQLTAANFKIDPAAG